MPSLQKQIPMYADFPGYMNRLYRDLEMSYEPFDASGNYCVPHAPTVLNAFHWYRQKTRRLQEHTA